MALSLNTVIKPEAGWYRGDFHAHTTFSDGYYTPLELIDVARTEKLDFFAITDHNTVDALSAFDPPADILIIPGTEITLKEGHFNIFGIEDSPNWLTQIQTGENRVTLQGNLNSFTNLMQQTAANGLLNSINHPLLTPWAWLDKATDLRHLHCLEIWNDPDWHDNAHANPRAVAMWTRWLNAGHRITAIGGVDYHFPQHKTGYNQPQRLSRPTTYVYAQELSGAAILEGLRQRRAYVSMGPQVTLQARVNGSTYGIGDDLGELEGAIEFSATVSFGSTPITARLLKNGDELGAASIEAGRGRLQHVDKIEAAQPAWYRLDVLGKNGDILAVTNPIFVGPRPQPARWKYGDFLET